MVYQVDVPLEGILETAAKALALDNKLAEAHTARGVALSAAREFDQANAEFEQALMLDPNSFEAHFLYARPAFQQGKGRGSLGEDVFQQLTNAAWTSF